MTNLRPFCTAAFALGLIGLFTTPAAAQFTMGGLSSGGLYFSASGQYVVAEDSDLTFAGVSIGEIDIDPDFGALGAVGWHTTMGLRGELEFSWSENDLGNIEIPGGLVAASGDAETIAGMANILYEFSAHPRISPYFGGGIGVADIDVDLSSSGLSASDSDTVFAYQFIGGAAITISDNVSLITDYRYFDTEDPDFSGVEAELTAHRFTAGIRISTR